MLRYKFTAVLLVATFVSNCFLFNTHSETCAWSHLYVKCPFLLSHFKQNLKGKTVF